jgi:hypothetical protein
MREALRKELEKQIPEIAKQYVENVESLLKTLKSYYGEELIVERPKGTSIWNSFKGANGMHINYKQHENFRSKFKEYCRKGYVYKFSEPLSVWMFDKEKVMPEALEYAKRAVRTWEDKIIGKLGELEEVEVPYYHGSYFVISGKRNNHEVSIHQQMIVNYRYDSHTAFNQFPARIYVDGNSWSASKYNKYFNN